MKTIDKFFIVVAVISGFLITAQLAFFIYIRLKIETIINDAASVGIIGSSDGPTAIFVSGANNNFSTFLNAFIYIAFLFSVVFITIRRVQRNRRS